MSAGWSLAGTAAAWDAEAALFDDEPDHGLRDPGVRDAWRDLLLSVLPPPPARVADLGCGTGTLGLLLAEQGYEVDGVDASPRMAALAAAKTAGRGVTTRVGDAGDPPLPRGTYDVVLTRHVLWALPHPTTALGRWTRLLAPGGRLVLVEGRWHTGAGLTAEQCVALVTQHRSEVEVRPLDDPAYWGGPVADERYLLLSGS